MGPASASDSDGFPPKMTCDGPGFFPPASLAGLAQGRERRQGWMRERGGDES